MAAGAAADLARQGWEALAAGDWAAARARFEEARHTAETAAVLDGLGRAAHFLGEHDEALALAERAFAAYLREDRPTHAADVARWLAFLHAAGRGNFAVGNGWIARAARLLEGVDECAAHGWVLLDRAPFTSDAPERERLATEALDIARRHGDQELEFDALSLLGETRVASGQVDDGMTMLDEAMAAVSSGEVVGVVARSDIVCRVMSACEQVTDVARAEQWLPMAERLVGWDAFVPPICRTHYAGILVATGRWVQAERELLSAMAALARAYPGLRGAPLARLADLRVRQGRLDEAQQLLEGLEWHPLARQLLAAVALGRADARLAGELVELCLETHGRPGPGWVPILELAVQVRLARGDATGAADARDRLDALAQRWPHPRVVAAAELAAGRVAAAEGDAQATAHLHAALERYAALDLPLEAARAQFELARALGDRAPAAASAEARRALQAFEGLGAAADADAAAALLRRLGEPGRSRPRSAGPLTRREREVLALLGAGCTNAQIAERLVISPRTAEHHVASILSKLGLRTRAQAAAHAVREGHAGPVPE